MEFCLRTRILYISCLFILISGCSSSDDKYEVPDTSSQKYKTVVSDFYAGLAAMQADQALFAVEKMQDVVKKYPAEPAGWANLSVFAMRQGNFEMAKERIDKAMALDSSSADIKFLAGILASRRGNINHAIGYFRKAHEADPQNPKISYTLIEELERQDASGNTEQISSILKSLLKLDPDNLAVLLETVRIASKWRNTQISDHALQMLDNQSRHWPPEVRQQFIDFKHGISESDTDNTTFQLAFLRNSLNELPKFQHDVSQIQLRQNQVGFLIPHFLWLPNPETVVDSIDDSLSFEDQILPVKEDQRLAVPVTLSDLKTSNWIAINGKQAIIDGDSLLVFPDKGSSLLSINSVSTLDFNYDFRNDLAFAGSGGFKLYELQEDYSLHDISTTLHLPASVLNDNYQGIWSRDTDSDGDLDIVLSPVSGSVVVLRNNGDGTFSTSDVFSSIKNPVNFLWADFDGDSDPDAAFLSPSGNVRVYKNLRSGEWKLDENFPDIANTINFEVTDFDSDGNFDLLAWNMDGVIQLSYSQEKGNWRRKKIIAESDLLDPLPSPGKGYVFVGDLDNNGSNDILLSGSKQAKYWLSDTHLSIISDSSYSIGGFVQGIADLNEDNRLDLIGLSDNGQAIEWINHGSKKYHARIIRPRASGPLGDRRINSFGIGGEIESRSGLLYEKHLIKQPWVHIGLGSYEEAEVLRIIWPNGSVQAEFAELGYGSQIFNEQSLKGSCPWLFTFNGKEMNFVTDFIWRSPLGLRINAQSTADVVQTEDRVKISADQLVAKDGVYDVRITADLWETHFFDYVELMSVDHPEGTDIFVNERFSIPPPDLKVHTTTSPHAVERVLDDEGKDVSEVVKAVDHRYLHHFKYTRYQGLAKDHYIEIYLGDDVPVDKPIWLLATGWVRPTDSSINFALSQGSNPSPEGISIEVPDNRGGWKVVKSNLGFPAGKSKTVMINLKGVLDKNGPRKLRLCTTTETYWDAIRWAEELSGRNLNKRMLDPQKMELHYRGFSKVIHSGKTIPELPDYQTISGTTQKWSDLTGYYTRYGDVSELLVKVDDRYVIMNAGDELTFQFKAPSPPQKGWIRDFVLVGDGWVKDGDYNTRFSKTVLPLPSHHIDQYQQATVPKKLENDPVYLQHKSDWVHYHTRYITPYKFKTALRTGY